MQEYICIARSYISIMKRFVYLFIGLFAYLIIPVSPAQAVGEFQADYDVEYSISPTSTTVVTQNISLTNNLTNLYPKEYSILLDTTRIKNVIAYDAKGVIRPKIIQKDGKTEIALTFNEQVVGLGKQLHFTLRFENDDIAKKLGNIWEISIPGVANDEDLARYDVTLKVPPTFGANAYMSPLPGDGKRWNKDQMTNGGISAAYGTEQLFSLSLSYFIENSTIVPKISEIALPPDTAYQKVTIDEISPKPKTVRQDADGNWLALYELTAGQKIDVSAKIFVRIFLNPQKGYTEALPDSVSYTKALKYWEILDPRIADLAREYKTPRKIYDYVRTSLSYDFNRVNQNPIRKGALQALDAPKTAICMEFTDLFIAIARAAGIPAREVVGYAYTTNTKLRPLSLVTDVLHAWPEYYDKERSIWVPIDPTWSSTTGGVNYFDKLDFNHIVFAIHGSQSDYPYPAGFYKRSGVQGKDVSVSFIEKPLALPQTSMTVSYDVPNTLTAGFSTKGNVNIQNSSGVRVDTLDVSVQSTPIDIAIRRSEKDIPPYGSIDIPITVTLDNYLYRGNGRISTTVNGDTTNFYFTIRPSYMLLLPIAIVVSLILIAVWIVTKRMSVWRR